MQVTGPEYLTRPVIDGDYLFDNTKNLLKNGKVNKADVMVGFTANEGALMASLCAKGAKSIDVEFFKVCNYGTLMVFGGYSKLSEEAVVMEYLGSERGSSEVLQGIMDVFIDMVFLAPAVQQAELLTKAGIPVYFYVMDHHPHAPRYEKAPTTRSTYPRNFYFFIIFLGENNTT